MTKKINNNSEIISFLKKSLKVKKQIVKEKQLVIDALEGRLKELEMERWISEQKKK